MDDFENAFGSAFNDSGTNKVVEDSQKKEESDLEKEQPDGHSTPEPVVSSSTESNTDAQPNRRRGRKKKTVADCDGGSTTEVGHFSCICDSKLIAQVRALAWKEHMTVRAVVEKMFSTCISKYEKKHGAIEVEQTKSTDELFWPLYLIAHDFSLPRADTELISGSLSAHFCIAIYL